MARLIHARKIDGEWRYKIWSTGIDDYVTHEMTEEQVRRQILHATLDRVIEEHEREWPGRLARAQKHGTSAHNYADDSCWHDINGPWKVEGEP